MNWNADQPDQHDVAQLRSGVAPWGRVAMATLALAGLGLSVFLTWVSLASGVQPPGCGTDSSCEQVLSSAWSRVLGVPVSAPAAALYALALCGIWAIGGAGVTRQRLGWVLLLGAAGSTVAGAGWFVVLQAMVVEGWCGWCLASHGVGVALAGLIFWQGHMQRSGGEQAGGIGPGLAMSGSLVGVLAVGWMGLLQLAAPSANPMVLDWAEQTGGEQLMAMHPLLRDELEMDVAAEPHVGDPQAEHVVAVAVDYVCPGCRLAHEQILAAQEAMDEAFVIMVLPLALSSACNEHVSQRVNPRFEDSCDLALLALAVHEADPEAFEPFEHWLFEQQPVSADEARARAEQLVGEAALETAMESGVPEQRLLRNTQVYGRLEADRVPIVLLPDRAVLGGMDQHLLQQLLEGEQDESEVTDSQAGR